MGVILPSEYQQVEYIESTGTQYIDTGIIFGHGIKITAEMAFVEMANSKTLFGVRKTTGATRFLVTYYLGIDFAYWGDTQWIMPEANAYYTLIFDASVEGRFTYGIPGDMKNKAIDELYTNITGYIFAYHRENDDTVQGQSKARFKSMVIEDANGTVLFNGIPCYHKTSGEIGIYDKANERFLVNQGTGTFLKGGDVIRNTPNLLDIRRRILLNTPHTETISGAMASFQTDVKADLKECKVYFSPIQSGSGDPSPENIRPISGWDGVEVYHSEKNILDDITPVYRNDGSCISGANGSILAYTAIGKACETWIDVSAYRGKKLTLNHRPTGNAGGFAFYSEKAVSGGYVTGFSNGGDSTQGSWTITIPTGDNINYMRFTANPNYIDDVKLMLEQESLTIPFPQTIYGGYVDLVRGEVVETNEHWLLTSVNSEALNASYNTETAVFFRCDVGHNFETYGTYAVTDLMCDMLSPTTSSIHVTPKNHINQINRRNSSTNKLAMIMLKSAFGITEEDTLAEMKTKISAYLAENPIGVSYKLATPNVYSLTPETIKTLKGINNIWSNSNGNVEVKFWTH